MAWFWFTMLSFCFLIIVKCLIEIYSRSSTFVLALEGVNLPRDFKGGGGHAGSVRSQDGFRGYCARSPFQPRSLEGHM